MNELRRLPYKNIGIVVFIRKDIAEDAIPINFEQFMNQYQQYELMWTPTEALRLALWICAQAVPKVFGQNIDILRASREALEEELELLWGKSLGKMIPEKRFPYAGLSLRFLISKVSYRPVILFAS